VLILIGSINRDYTLCGFIATSNLAKGQEKLGMMFEAKEEKNK
jgi:hypothetical protein